MSIHKGFWLTVPAAAKLKGVSREAVGRAIHDGRLDAEWAGSAYIVHRRDLHAWTPRGHAPSPVRAWREEVVIWPGTLCAECGRPFEAGATAARMVSEPEVDQIVCRPCLLANPWPMTMEDLREAKERKARPPPAP